MYIKEIFHSFQGEGPLIGYPQIFIRFYGCNIHCAYCDEPDFVEDRNTHTIESILETIQPMLAKKPHSISITGGEPLIQVKAMKALIPHLPLPIYLETNGTLPHHLDEVKDLITYFAVDYKHGFNREFTDFIEKIRNKPNVFVKYVLVRDFPIQDVQQIAKILHTINPNIPLILQPVTPFAEIKQKVKPEDIERAYTVSANLLNDVRIIPQTHKFMGLR